MSVSKPSDSITPIFDVPFQFRSGVKVIVYSSELANASISTFSEKTASVRSSPSSISLTSNAYVPASSSKIF